MSESLCYLCHNQPPTFVCFCTEVQVCKSCISSHLLDNPSIGHKPVPLNFQDLIQALRSERKEKDTTADPQSRQRAREEKRSLLRREIERLTSFQTEVLLSLQTIRMRLERQVAATMEEIALGLTTQTEAISARLKQMAADDEELASPSAQDFNSSDFAEELLRLTFEVKEVELAPVIKSSLKVLAELRDLSAERHQSSLLYKVFGGSNSVGVFDAKTEKHIKTLSASIKFYHNSCSCESDNSHLFITGGSLTGRSRNEVYSYSPANNTAQEVASMHIARRSHCSIFAGQYLYVFGGLLEEDRLSLCERYRPETDRWEDVAQMKERRAYLSCCEYKGNIYLGGGSDHSSIERYDLHKDQFTLIPVPHNAIEDNCCMLALPDTILLFHGSFRGEVTKYDPASERFTREAEMCVGNSWSSCPPVLVNRTVYMLRSDSVFKYALDSGESAYVLRMAKIVKKRMTFDE